MGIWLANMKNVHVEDILNFKESLSILLISGLFILLAARLNLEQFQALGYSALFLFLFIQLFARPIKVIVSTINSDLSWQEKFMVSWIGPRGIVAAAVTALFSIRLQDIGINNAELLVPLAFSIIIGTVFLQGSTSKFIANKLGVAEPDDDGFLIVGANPVARTLAQALNDNGFHTLITDDSWTNIRQARMEGLKTYYGNAVSVHADRHLDLIGLGDVLTITPHNDRNALVGQRYRTEFDRDRIFCISTENDKEDDEQTSRKIINHTHKILFNRDHTFSKLASFISQGATTKQTNITESFSFEDYQQQYGKRAIPLFAFTAKGRLRFFLDDVDLLPEEGWTVIALVKEGDQKQEA